MKKLAAILLLGIFSFNIVGYRLIASFLEHTENTKIELALDADEYTDNQLITIRQPINLPYYQNTRNFQRINGEVELQGVIYKYVKCRIYNDSLELLCIPNTGKMKIKATSADFSEMVADVQQPAKKKSGNALFSIYKVVSEFDVCQQVMVREKRKDIFHYLLKNELIPVSLFQKTLEHPPDGLPV